MLQFIMILVVTSDFIRVGHCKDGSIGGFNSFSTPNSIYLPADRPLSFLPTQYDVKDSTTKFFIRNVPGDGGCLFHSLAVAITYRRNKSHPKYFDKRLRELSNNLRQLSVKLLGLKNIRFCMEGEESIVSDELLEMVAANYNMTGGEYLAGMTKPATWGGGPEIVALSNHFKRPIHVYELDTVGVIRKRFQLKICARFGSPFFYANCPLFILCADGRFPNVKPGQQKPIGDHFLAIFPSEPDFWDKEQEKLQRKPSFNIFSPFHHVFRSQRSKEYGGTLNDDDRKSIYKSDLDDMSDFDGI